MRARRAAFDWMAMPATGALPRAIAYGLALVVAVALSACASSEQARERQAAAQAAEDATDDAKCREGGAEPDTPAYAQCRDRLSQRRAEQQAQQAKRNEAFQRTLGEGTSALSGH